MGAVVLRKEFPAEEKIKATGPHPSAAVLSAKADAAKARSEATGYKRARAPEWLLDVLASLAGLALFIGVWAVIAKQGGRIPDPLTVAAAAAKIFADPFYSKGPNDQGIGWNILSSLRRV